MASPRRVAIPNAGRRFEQHVTGFHNAISARLGGQRVTPNPVMVKIEVEYDETAMSIIEAICKFAYPELPMEEAFGQLIVDALRERQSE